MYQADRASYQAYGATVVAWGGRPTPASLAESQGAQFFGSVGMVTEFARFYERFPLTYAQALCRDVQGRPVKVPWLTDHQHKGVPFWWSCTQQPQFREYLRERVAETIRAGAHGLHIDDHMGTAGGLWLGLCFCERCVEGFRFYLASLAASDRQRLGVSDPASFDYRAVVARWMEEAGAAKRQPPQHPLWEHWTIYQCRAAAAFMEELRDLAARVAGRPVPVGANAGLLWPRHLADYKSLDLFSAETDHQAAQKRLSDMPLFAYRLADAVGRPYAATASGADWAWVAEHSRPGLVRGWIALSYAAGHMLMAPHRQWCHTPEKGTHWYAGPADKFAPLYQFVRRNSALIDQYEAFADLAVVLPHRSFLRHTSRWLDLCRGLAENNVSYRLLLGGDEIVSHPLRAADVPGSRVLLIPDRSELLPADIRTLEENISTGQVVCGTLEQALAAITPAVRLDGEGPVRILPRVRPGGAAIHLLNYSYDSARDDVVPMEQIRVKVNCQALGFAPPDGAWLVAPGSEPRFLPLVDGAVEVPTLGLWGILAFAGGRE